MQDPTQQAPTTPQEPQGVDPAAPQEPTIDPYVGTPEVDVLSWVGLQSYPDTCVVRSEEFILEMFTGLPVDEHALVQESADNGWYTPGTETEPGGTPWEYVGNTLELHGIPTHSYSNATTYDLANELAQGHKVMVGVDAGELWGVDEKGHPEEAVLQEGEDPSVGQAPDHVLVVSGIDTSNPDDVRGSLSDPGTGDAAASYPMDQFVAAWQDSDFFMCATDEPAPSSLPEMTNFDYESGHIPEVMGMPYEEFANLDPQSDQWNSLVEQVEPPTDTGYEETVQPPTDTGYEETVQPPTDTGYDQP